MSPSIAQAKKILGADLIGPEEVQTALGVALDAALEIPFSVEDLEAAHGGGDLLVYRIARLDDEPLTIARLAAKFPDLFNENLLRGTGYQLKNDWGILLEPLAESEVCRDGWAWITADVLPQTRFLDYDEQDAAIAKHLAERGLTQSGARRRTAVEAVYDTVITYAALKRRLLESTWDWTSSMTEDLGFLQVGGFGKSGLEILSYSPGIRHGALGACLTRQPGS